jgi:hypothetical protein
MQLLVFLAAPAVSARLHRSLVLFITTGVAAVADSTTARLQMRRVALADSQEAVQEEALGPQGWQTAVAVVVAVLHLAVLVRLEEVALSSCDGMPRRQSPRFRLASRLLEPQSEQTRFSESRQELAR